MAGLAAASFPLGEMERVRWFSGMGLPLDVWDGDDGGGDEEGRGQETEEGRGEVDHICEPGWGVGRALLPGFYRSGVRGWTSKAVTQKTVTSEAEVLGKRAEKLSSNWPAAILAPRSAESPFCSASIMHLDRRPHRAIRATFGPGTACVHSSRHIEQRVSWQRNGPCLDSRTLKALSD